MYETTVFFTSSIRGALKDFCSVAVSFGKDTVHAEQLSQAIEEQYRGGFLMSMRAYRMISFLVQSSLKGLGHVRTVTLIPFKAEYCIQWVEEGFIVSLFVPRCSTNPFRLFVYASDTRTVRACADRFGIKECKVEISPDTLLTLEEFGRINWNEVARSAQVPYSEWLALLNKYLKK